MVAAPPMGEVPAFPLQPFNESRPTPYFPGRRAGAHGYLHLRGWVQ
jgi:hypothetical protein